MFDRYDAKWKYWSFVIGVILAIVVGVRAYQVSRDIDGWVYRAQVAADAQKVADRLDTALSNMRKYGVTRGHAALIFHRPENDVALDYEALGDLKARAETVSEYDKGSTEYQVALDDIRGTLREIEVDADWFSVVHNPLSFLAVGLIVAAIVQLLSED